MKLLGYLVVPMEMYRMSVRKTNTNDILVNTVITIEYVDAISKHITLWNSGYMIFRMRINRFGREIRKMTWPISSTLCVFTEYHRYLWLFWTSS
jgi:hypothetical protein